MLKYKKGLIDTHLLPATDAVYDLGSSTQRWRNGYFARTVDAGSLNIGGTSVITSGKVLQNIASIRQTLTPTANNTYDLGSSTLRWRNGHFAQWLFVGRQVISQDPIWVEDFDTDHSADWEILSSRYLSVTWDTANSRLILENPGTLNGYGVYRYKGKTFVWNNVQIIYDVEYEASDVWGGLTLDETLNYIDANPYQTTYRAWGYSGRTVYPTIGETRGPGLTPGRHKVVINIIGGEYMEIWVDGKLHWAGYDTSGSLRKREYYFGIVSSYSAGKRFYVYKIEIRPLAFRVPTTEAQPGLFTPSGYIQSPVDIKFDKSIQPSVDNTYNIGSSSLRWANLYAVNVYTGDLNFEEKVCEVCGQPFLKDDELVLKVKEVDDYTRTVPIHLRCSKEVKVD